MIPWEALEVAGVLAPLDRALGQLLARMAPADPPVVALAGALASRALAEGHTALRLDEASVSPPTTEEGEPIAGLVWPEASTWAEALAASPLVSADGARTPLVLRGGRLALARYAAHEARVVKGLVALAGAPVLPVLLPRLQSTLASLFADLPNSADQQDAVRAAAERALAVLAGGPGSGKTSTVVRLLAALIDQAFARGEPAPRVLLLAPTGKAAARLGESIREQVGDLRVSEADRVRVAIPSQARTIHRALGPANDWTTRVRHDADHPWGADVVVVDEASMVDTPLLARVIDALKPGARLVLLGDPFQLAAVGVGAVLADLCRLPLPPPLAGCVVRLSGSHRFGRDKPIGRLAAAIRERDVAEVEAALPAAGPVRLERHEGALARDPAFVASLVEGWRPFAAARTPEARLAALDAFRVLCATRVGPSGVEALVPAIERGLHRAGLLHVDGPWYDGRPILVTTNDPGTRLSNGDVGVVARDASGEVRVWFADLDATTGARTLRPVLPARLPAHETVYAMTVHKSQGSQFQHVVLCLPEAGSRVLSNELLYTAVTRARDTVRVVGTPEAVRAGVVRGTVRVSGLDEALGLR